MRAAGAPCLPVEDEAGLISIDNIQLWAGWGVGGLSDVDKVQVWLVLLRGWAAKEERGGRSREKRASERALGEERPGGGSRGTGMKSMLVCGGKRPCCSF